MQIETSPYHTAGIPLINKGIIVIPLTLREKTPVAANWTNFTLKDSQYYTNKTDPYNLGLILGSKNGIIALDFDHNTDNLHQKILKICGQSEVVKKGSKGGTIFFRYNGEKSKKWKKNGEMIIELLSDGTQTVLPPSIHPATNKEYFYTKGKSLVDIDVNTLPLLPLDFTDRVDDLFNIKNHTATSSSIQFNTVVEALYFIKASDYDTWLKVGMALKNDFAQEGYDEWIKWSKTDPKCKEEELDYKWNSFKGDGITSATILKMAIENGYVVPKSSSSFYSINTAKLEFDRWRLKGRPIGLNTGIEAFDNLLHIREKEFTLITGTPNSGKSEFLDYLLYNLVKNHGQKVMFASFEKDPADHIESFVHRFIGKSLEKRTKQEEDNALSVIKDKLYFYNHLYESRGIDDILKQACELHRKIGLNILAIDPYSYLTSQDIANEFTNVRYICIALTKFAKKTGCHVFLVAHPKTLDTRTGKAPKITLYAVSGGANFYNKCDNGIIISRQDKEIEVDIQKVRHQTVDSCGSFILEYDKSTRSFNSSRGEF